MTWRLISSLLPHRVDWREDISAYMDGELSPRDRARVESRLAESAAKLLSLIPAELHHKWFRQVWESEEPPRSIIQPPARWRSPSGWSPCSVSPATRSSIAARTSSAGLANGTFEGHVLAEVDFTDGPALRSDPSDFDRFWHSSRYGTTL